MPLTFSGHGLIALLVLALASTAQEVRKDPERERLESLLKQYHALVDAYREGNDTSVTDIIGWERKRLTEIVGAVHTGDVVRRAHEAARFQAAAMLHTDAAVRLLETDESLAVFHLEVASRMLLIGGPPLHLFARTWYLAVSGILRDRARPLIAEALLGRARQHLPGDAIVLYESAVVQELIATYSAFVTETKVSTSPFPTNSMRDVRNPDNTPATTEDRRVRAWRRAMDNASRWFVDALKADPSSELAQLHLGRVQTLRGSYDEASTLLQRLAASGTDADIAYLAAMFLGALHDRRGRRDDAERTYRQAIERRPMAQSAYVALSEILQKRGRGDESREVLTNMLRQPADSRDEPWWWYLAEPIERVRRRTEALRAWVRK